MKQLYCITCPAGCLLTAEQNNGELIITGNQCKLGTEFAKKELTSPTRSLTTTVRTVYPEMPVLPVRTLGEIPKDKIFEAMHILKHIIVDKPLDCGDTVLDDIAGTGIKIISTSNGLLRL